MPNLLNDLVANPSPPPFAVLRRSEGHGVEVLVGDIVDVERLEDIPIAGPGKVSGPTVLAMVPYRQITERGFTCHDDETPLRCLIVRDHEIVELDHVLAMLPDDAVEISASGFNVDDNAYAELVGQVIDNEIGRGEGANFVIRRDFLAHTSTPLSQATARLLRRLLLSEQNAYWTFAVYTGDHVMVGATPERHVSVLDNQVLMNPISGTYRFPANGPTGEDLLNFLADTKETEELFMVVDEELKIMSRVCERGGQVLGPYLKQMSALAHTEYLLSGHTELDFRDVLRETMFAPTVTGSPLQNATRVITRYEQTGRGYYGGVLALFDQDADGQSTMDAPILIRTAYIDAAGQIRVPVGATLVRHSLPDNEVAETHTKAAGVLRALGVLDAPNVNQRKPAPTLAEYPGVAHALSERNKGLAEFWLRPQHDRPLPQFVGRKALIIDAEDTWTEMLAHVLRRLGMTATVCPWQDAAPHLTDGELLVFGPGPGDPRNIDDQRIARLHELIRHGRASGQPLLAVCLSHQILTEQLGLTVAPLPAPYQGTQRRIDLFGRQVRVGFYNSYTATSSAAAIQRLAEEKIQLAADPDSGQVHAVRGPGFASVQFHLESLLSPDGVDILTELAGTLLNEAEAEKVPSR